jgi:hypothetical protein
VIKPEYFANDFFFYLVLYLVKQSLITEKSSILNITYLNQVVDLSFTFFTFWSLILVMMLKKMKEKSNRVL